MFTPDIYVHIWNDCATLAKCHGGKFSSRDSQNIIELFLQVELCPFLQVELDLFFTSRASTNRADVTQPSGSLLWFPFVLRSQTRRNLFTRWNSSPDGADAIKRGVRIKRHLCVLLRTVPGPKKMAGFFTKICTYCLLKQFFFICLPRGKDLYPSISTIQLQSWQILHKFFFPNSKNESYERFSRKTPFLRNSTTTEFWHLNQVSIACKDSLFTVPIRDGIVARVYIHTDRVVFLEITHGAAYLLCYKRKLFSGTCEKAQEFTDKLTQILRQETNQ
jgi:hypothetical protein